MTSGLGCRLTENHTQLAANGRVIQTGANTE